MQKHLPRPVARFPCLRLASWAPVSTVSMPGIPRESSSAGHAERFGFLLYPYHGDLWPANVSINSLGRMFGIVDWKTVEYVPGKQHGQ